MKNKLFAVTYEIDYTHRVVVGVKAPDAESAKQMAETAFNDGTLWDDTEAMPLLFDDFEEVLNETLRFSVEEVSCFPEPDSSVVEIKQREAAFHACRMLLNGNISLARNSAKEAFPSSQNCSQELDQYVDQCYLIALLGQEPDLQKTFMDNPNAKWCDIKTVVETQAMTAVRLNQPMSENTFELGSWQRKWYLDKYLSLLSSEQDCSPKLEGDRSNG